MSAAQRGPFAGDGPFASFLRRVSLSYRGFDFVRELDVYAKYSPLRAFALFDHYDHDARAGAIAALGLAGALECTEAVSARPVHDGFVALLAFTPGARVHEHGPRVDEFFMHEDRRDVEEHLRACYGRDVRDEEDDHLFRFMDYPSFDNGSAGIGYGIMVPDDRTSTRWLWSRVSFAHK